jgi:hypothetical protein
MFRAFLARRHIAMPTVAASPERKSRCGIEFKTSHGVARASHGGNAGVFARELAGVYAMATFRCSKCGCDEDTAFCNYWSDRVRDIPPACSACDPRIGKWHGQFPRLFGVFLVTPSPGPTPRPREALARLVGRLAEAGHDRTAKCFAKAGSRSGSRSGSMADRTSFFDDPVPSYKPRTASK